MTSEIEPTENVELLHRGERFVLRRFRMEDAAAYAAYRSDWSTAEFQSWTIPYPIERAEESIANHVGLSGPTNDQWFGFALADPQTDVLIGDIAVHLESNGRTAMIGYNLSANYRRQGIATAAVRWTIDYLFAEKAVTRIYASLHPQNWASAMMLEHLGFVYEGTLRQSFWVDDECTDDPHYGLLRADWDAWNARPRHAPEVVELTEVTHQNAKEVFKLETHFSQRRFVSPMGKSAADALVPAPDDDGGVLVPWYRAIVADGLVVGFVMVAAATPTLPHPFIWRLLIDRLHQRRGIGTRVLDCLVEQYRAAGHDQVRVSWKPGIGSPEPLYMNYGFVLTGEEEDGEVVAALNLKG